MRHAGQAGPFIFLLCAVMILGSCTPARFCRESQRTDLLATGLVGWQVIGSEQGRWRLTDGVLTGRASSDAASAGADASAASGAGWLATVDQYGDFVLSLEFRISPGADGGVFLRSPLRGDPSHAGIEVQILDDATREWGDLQPDQFTGSLFDIQAPSERAGRGAGQWQQMAIKCRGSRIAVALNGKQVVDTDVTFYPYLYERHPGLTRRSGYIGLQVESGVIEFRNIHIEPLE
ncbi:MAG: DUF1080 domain-containing protein [Phycisphaerae bacterium]|nr:DUF1080 domain-containing protein [Phycisphaerae bacterium]